MINEQDILDKLDHSKDGTYCTFIWLGDASAYLLDTRLNILRDDNGNWAIVGEKLGYNPRADSIMLEISYYGNCLTNLEEYNNQKTNYYHVFPVDHDSFMNASNYEHIKNDAEFITVRGQKIKIEQDKSKYENAGITFEELEPGEIHWSEASRLIILTNPEIFRATDEEIYKSIPKTLKKVLVIDEWYHRDFEIMVQPPIPEDQLKQTFEFNKNLTGLAGMDFETFKDAIGHQQMMGNDWNQGQWEDNRPSSYETWQLIAKVVSTGDSSYYKPSIAANSHWTNWPDSGSM